MIDSGENSVDADILRSRIEARLPSMLGRVGRVKLQTVIPAHWFATAASECASMFVDGHFYGTISVAQAYIEALSKFLAEKHGVPVRKDSEQRCRRLADAGVISTGALDAALAVLENRNDFHHLNKEVPCEYGILQQRAEDCINSLYKIESELFGYSVGAPEVVTPTKPEYWPRAEPDALTVYIRNLVW